MDNAALRARFNGYDQNGDGQLELAEFAQLLDELGAGYAEAQIRSAFTSLDADQNGSIDFDEFAGWWVGS
jgi:Ca2+-binding EF-hand superfamily protein